MPTGVYYDLPAVTTTAQANGPKVFGYNVEVFARYYTQEFFVAASSFTPLALNTQEIIGGITYYLVNESDPEDMGGGLLKWTRTYYQKPPNRTECEPIVYNYCIRNLIDADTGTPVFFAAGANFSMQVKSNVFIDYWATDDPSTIPLVYGFRLFKIDNALVLQGTEPGAGGGYYQGDDSEITRWKGDIWQRKNRYVPYPSLDIIALL